MWPFALASVAERASEFHGGACVSALLLLRAEW